MQCRPKQRPLDGMERAAGGEAEQGEEGPVVMGTKEKQRSRQGG